MSFAANSHPEREQLARGNRVEYLQGLRARLAVLPDPMKVAPVACPLCGSAMSVTAGRRSGRVFLRHPVGDCQHSDDLWSFSGTREEAIDRWYRTFSTTNAD